MKIICGPCVLNMGWKLEDRISMARLRKLDVQYNCDECHTDFIWSFNGKAVLTDINNTREILVQTSLF